MKIIYIIAILLSFSLYSCFSTKPSYTECLDIHKSKILHKVVLAQTNSDGTIVPNVFTTWDYVVYQQCDKGRIFRVVDKEYWDMLNIPEVHRN